MKRKVVIFTGAGISAESGVKTFRDNDGLWEEYKIQDVATTAALKNNTEVFCKFYNLRKEQMKTVFPNDAHLIAAHLETNFDVTVVTQNVDDLHEKAGSSEIYHLHGTLSKIRSSFNPAYELDFIEDIKVGDLCPDGAQMRPSVVLFGESLPYGEYEKSVKAISKADVIVIVGTSMQVYPAAGMPWNSPDNALIYYIDPNDINFEIPKEKKPFFYHIKAKATEGMKIVADDLKDIFL